MLVQMESSNIRDVKSIRLSFADFKRCARRNIRSPDAARVALFAARDHKAVQLVPALHGIASAILERSGWLQHFTSSGKPPDFVCRPQVIGAETRQAKIAQPQISQMPRLLLLNTLWSSVEPFARVLIPWVLVGTLRRLISCLRAWPSRIVLQGCVRSAQEMLPERT